MQEGRDSSSSKPGDNSFGNAPGSDRLPLDHDLTRAKTVIRGSSKVAADPGVVQTKQGTPMKNQVNQGIQTNIKENIRNIMEKPGNLQKETKISKWAPTLVMTSGERKRASCTFRPGADNKRAE